MNHYLALTIIADDRPGIIEKIADVVSANGGNWLESNMSRLAGKFAGILLVNIAEEKKSALLEALNTLGNQGIRVSGETSVGTKQPQGEHLMLTVVGNDRPGIVGELSSLLARLHVNVEELSTSCEDAPMSSETLFRATAKISLPSSGVNRDQLQNELESLSDDLMVELESI
ncbi:MAG: glycine cleavage system regulatory protein [Porticoccus sp.]|jgi:glycine cleavage system regulatory protein